MEDFGPTKIENIKLNFKGNVEMHQSNLNNNYDNLFTILTTNLTKQTPTWVAATKCLHISEVDLRPAIRLSPNRFQQIY